MSLPLFVAVALFASAALLAQVSQSTRTPGLARVARLLAALGSAALLPSLLDGPRRPASLLALGLGIVAPEPVPLALAALVTLLEGIRGPSGGGLLAAVLALAGVAASRGFSMSLRNLLAQSREAGGAFFGFAASAALLIEGRGLVLAWRTGGGLPMRGAGALLGGAFLLCLLGSLLLAATFLSRESLERARLLGERALILAFGLLALGAGLKTALLASRFPEALPAEGRSLSLLWGGVMALALGVLCLLGEGPLEPAPSGDREIRIAAALAGACLLGAGLSSWLSEGTSWGGAVPLLLSTAILGLGARAFGWGALLGRGAFLAALLYALA